jgi:glycosyltransferase involved in cell wall biosynthesis
MSLVRHLPADGWDTVVLTPRNAGHPLRDDGALARVPAGTLVVRTGIVEPGQVRRWLARRGAAEPKVPFEGPRDGQSDGRAQLKGSVRGMARRSRRVAGRVSRRIFFPDEQVGWFPFALIGGLRVMRRRHPDVIWSTSSPVTSHLIAGVLATIGRRAWVADFRDPWVDTPAAQHRPRLQQWLMQRFEAWILGRADHVTFVTPGLTEDAARMYPARRSRFSTLPNGYDREELEDLLRRRERDAPRASGPFRLVHAGTLYRPPEVATFLSGLSLAVERGVLQPGKVELEFVGAMSTECQALISAWSQQPGHGSFIKQRDFVMRAEALTIVANADAALVLMGDEPGMERYVSVKLYEAIGLDLQVFAMAPDGDLRNVLLGLQWGIVAEPDQESVARAFEELIASPPPTRRADPDGRYDRARLAGEVARILDAVSRDHRHSPARRS